MGVIATTFKQKWTDFVLHVINNPKTSLIGLFSFVSITSLALTPFIHHPVYSVVLSIGSALVRAWYGLLLKDPGTTAVVTPENPVPHAEPSTEIPLNPDASIVHTE